MEGDRAISKSWMFARARAREKYFKNTIVESYKSILARAYKDSDNLLSLTRTFPNNEVYSKQLEITESRISHYNNLIDKAFDEILEYLDNVELASFEMNVLEGAI